MACFWVFVGLALKKSVRLQELASVWLFFFSFLKAVVLTAAVTADEVKAEEKRTVELQAEDPVTHRKTAVVQNRILA